MILFIKFILLSYHFQKTIVSLRYVKTLHILNQETLNQQMIKWFHEKEFRALLK